MCTGNHPGSRGKHSTNAGREDRGNGRHYPCNDGGMSDDQRNVPLFREHEKTGAAH